MEGTAAKVTIKHCEVCTWTAHACGGPVSVVSTFRGTIDVLAIKPISVLRTFLRVTEVLNDTRHLDQTTAPQGRPMKLSHYEAALLPLLKRSFEQAKAFQKHLMKLLPGVRENHVKANPHSKEMLEAARFLDGKGKRPVENNTAREVLAILLARYVSPAWIEKRVSGKSLAQRSLGNKGTAG